MGVMVSQITRLAIFYSTVCSEADQRKINQSSGSLAFVRGIYRWPVNSPHKWPVTQKIFPFDDVIMSWWARPITFGLGFCLLSASGHVFHTAWETMNKSCIPSNHPSQIVSLQRRHYERDVVWNHQPHDCLLKRLFRRRPNKTSKLIPYHIIPYTWRTYWIMFLL